MTTCLYGICIKYQPGCICEGCCTLKRCRFRRWLPPPASAEQYCSTSASVFVPTTYLVLVLLKQVPTTSSCITQYRHTITSRRRGNKSESQIFVFVFRRFAETNLFSELSFLFFASALLHLRVCASARPSLSLHYSVRPSVPPSEQKMARFAATNALDRANGRSPLFSENLLFSRVALFARSSVRPSFRPFAPPIPPFLCLNGSRQDFAATNALEERAGAPYFSERVGRGASCAGEP